MDKHNYKWYRENANKWKENEFSLNVKRDDYSLAHLICEGARISGKYGISGDAFRHWVTGLFKDGVYLYVDNYNVGIKCTENPDTKLISQCQDSCAYGNPWPKPIDGDWIDYKSLPEQAQLYINNIVRELSEHIYERIITVANKIEEQVNEEARQLQIKQQEINDKWLNVCN